ncbi:MAG: tetratricopeptide repeat protein [Planctomycetota bacterium]
MKLLLSPRGLAAVLLFVIAGCAERIDSFEEYLELAWRHERAGDQQQAIVAYQQALQHEPMRPIAWYDLGVLYEATGQPELAVNAWTQAITHDPDYTQAYVNRGTLLAQQGKHELALADFSRAIELAPTEFAPRRNRADLHRELNQNTEALADYTEALRLNPRDAETWSEYGTLCRTLDDWVSACWAFKRTTEFDAASEAGWQNLAEAFERLGRTTEANSARQQANELAANANTTSPPPASVLAAGNSRSPAP